MKTQSYSLLFFLLLVGVSCTDHNDLNISVKDSDDLYKFTAHYNYVKTAEVQALINKEISPTHFDEDSDWNVSAILDDKTKLKIISTPGDLEIRLDKEENSRSSYRRVQKLCAEIKKVIVEK